MSDASSQVNNPFTCPAPYRGQVGTGTRGHLSPLSPSLSGDRGRDRGRDRLPAFELERITTRRRAATESHCPTCGRPTWTGLDDTPSGPQTETVTLDHERLTRLGMYQAATTGRHIYTLRSSKTGYQIDWLGHLAKPNPERDHLLAAHSCDLPRLETHPDVNLAEKLNGIPPF